MILPIYVEPNPVLHQVCPPVKEVTAEIRQLATDMRETMHNADGVGLAAPQVGKLLPLIVLEAEDSEKRGSGFPFLALINPRVTWKSTQLSNFTEGCLSIPGWEGVVRRPLKVRVKAMNLEGETISIEADGLLARVLQHEIDHLHGVLFTSYLKKNELKTKEIIDYPRL